MEICDDRGVEDVVEFVKEKEMSLVNGDEDVIEFVKEKKICFEGWWWC